ncbi:MAG: DUF418 domain-containing protein [Ferruginibacter sp.]|nr:DUF418 domain-containing protein [Chitinophagaceae bacterium]
MDQNNLAAIPPEVNSGPTPVASADRIKSIDTIRGVALLGILMMNINVFGINWNVYYDIPHGPHSGKDFYTFTAIFTFFEGTMRGLFSMLFGAGMVLFMLSKKDVPGQPTVAEYYYRRLLWLVLFGLINAFILLWPGDILFYYGFCGMVLFAFRKLSPKWLVLLALVCVSITMIKQQWGWNETLTQRQNYTEAVAAKKENKKLTAEQQGAIKAWTAIEKRQKPDTAFVNNNLRKIQSGYGTVFSYFLPRTADDEIWYLYNGVWDMLCMMFLGMALFTWGFFSNKLRTSTYGLWLLVGYGAGIPIGWVLFNQGWLGYAGLGVGEYADRYRSSHQLFTEFRRILITIGHASLVMLIFRSRVVPWLMKALANVGQMAFTNYLMQSIICTWFFYGYGFGYFNKLRFHQLYYVVGAVWVFQLIFSAIWLRYFRFGPFEWLWRSLTYWKRQPMRR